MHPLARPLTACARVPRVAIVGAGWAGLSAAVQAVQRGWSVTVLEMAPQPGGRARSQAIDDRTAAGAERAPADNGQHILIGAYVRTLALMRTVGVDPRTVLWRGPLALVGPDGHGLRLGRGPTALAFARAVASHPQWSWPARISLLRHALSWRLQGFDCADDLRVGQLCATLHPQVMASLIEPLCVAALNTSAEQASARVLLRVLGDSLAGGPGHADLLLPAAALQALLPGPAWRWLQARGAGLHLRQRVHRIDRTDDGRLRLTLPPATADTPELRSLAAPWDGVVLACAATEAARLAEPLAPDWAACNRGLAHEPILTVWLREPGLRLAHPMVTLPARPAGPAQFAFDLAQCRGDGTHQPPLPHPDSGLQAWVASAPTPWLDAGIDGAARATLEQARALYPGHFVAPDAQVEARCERRATFRCTPGLRRPGTVVAPALVAAGDHIDGPYPATLEGAVRSGEAAVQALAHAIGADQDIPGFVMQNKGT
ncbi:MAG: hypothetical protein RLY78_1490 [Pseudomonadota bacterium]